MIRVDMIGANAVGKTTLLRRYSRAPGSGWLPVKAALSERAFAALKQHGNAQAILSQVLRALPETSLKKRWVARVLKTRTSSQVWDQPESFRDFIDTAIAISSTLDKEPIQKLSGLKALYDSLNTLGLLADWSEPVPVLFDESLCQKVYGILDPKTTTTEQLNQYFGNMPEPQLLLHCTTDFECHVRQYKARYKRRGYAVRNSQFYLKDDAELLEDLKNRRWIAEHAAEFFRNRGIEVVSLDTRGAELRLLDEAIERVKAAVSSDATASAAASPSG